MQKIDFFYRFKGGARLKKSEDHWITEKVPLDDYVMELCLLSLQNHQMDSRNPEL